MGHCVVIFPVFQIIHPGFDVAAVEQLLNQQIITSDGNALLTVIEVVVIECKPDRKPLDDIRGKHFAVPSPLLFGIALYQLAEDSTWMMLGEEARFDPNSNTWFEYMGCGYACWRAGKALQEADEIDLYHFQQERPQLKCRESFFDLEYGNTRDDVAYGLFILMEYDGTKHRSFSFDLKDVTMKQAKEYVSAMESWHSTGKLNIGAFNGYPNCDSWQK